MLWSMLSVPGLEPHRHGQRRRPQNRRRRRQLAERRIRTSGGRVRRRREAGDGLQLGKLFGR
jgi:hypothetical protein